MGLAATLTFRQTLRFLEFFEFKCAYCGADFKTFSHIIPAFKGGTLTVTNILPSCWKCNPPGKPKHNIPLDVKSEFRHKIELYFSLPDMDDPPYRNQDGWLGPKTGRDYLPFDKVSPSDE